MEKISFDLRAGSFAHLNDLLSGRLIPTTQMQYNANTKWRNSLQTKKWNDIVEPAHAR
jgi:hypothetical protein